MYEIVYKLKLYVQMVELQICVHVCYWLLYVWYVTG